MLEVGEKVKDYTLKRFLGGGTFGDVWLAEKELELSDEGILFALKFLPNQSAAHIHGEGVRNEVKTWIKAGKHSNIVRVYDGFIHGRYLVIVSDYIEDGSLREWLEANQKKAPSLEKAVEMLRGILRGLSHLHARRIIHRDLKPENILLEDGVPKITDFGVSRMVETFSQSATLRLTNGAGSPLYMPPEAFGENTPMPQLDIWSAGVMFYEMLSGGWPFTGNSMYALFAEITAKDPRPLPENVPQELQVIVMTALLKDTKRRFQAAEQMREALDEAWAALLQRQQPLLETKRNEDWLEKETQKPAAEKEAEQGRKPLGESHTTEELPAAEVFFKYGSECYKKKDYDGAIQNYSKAIELNPRYAEAYSDRGNSYYMKDDYDQAFTDYNKAIELNPQLAHAYLNRGDIYYGEKEYDQALLDYNRAIQVNPQYAAAYYKRGEFYFNAYLKNVVEDDGNYDRAIRDYNKAIKLNPQYAVAYNRRGYAFYYKGYYDQAMMDYNKAIELDPRAADAFHHRALVYHFHEEDWDRAIVDYNKAIELNPQDAGAYYRRGLIYKRSGDYDQAITNYNKAIELNPQDAYAYQERGRAYEALGQKAKERADRQEYKEKAKADQLKYEKLYKESERKK
jgi:serine/threonine protein kinase